MKVNLIETNNLSKQYNNFIVVNKVNMHVPEGSIYGFVGENGSGKTTIMRLITGLANPTSGTITLFGMSSKDKEVNEKRKKISAIVENAALVSTLTAIQNMQYQELYEGIRLTDEERQELLRKVHLENTGNKKVKNFSLGMKQRLAIALSLMKKPNLMLLDEPMNGLDPEGIVELRELLIELNRNDGITILISSHILSELEKIASCYGFISHGKLIEELTAEELQNKCRKSLSIKVDNVEKAKDVLHSIGIDNATYSTNGEIKIFDEIRIADLVMQLEKNRVDVLAINSNDESVEDYYLNLTKGAL